MSEEVMNCPICKLGSQDVKVADYGERIGLNCARCGNVRITRTAAKMAESKQLSPKLSAWLRERTELGAESGEINRDNLQELANLLPAYTVSERFLLLMQAIERKTTFPGEKVTLKPALDYPLSWAASEKVCRYLVIDFGTSQSQNRLANATAIMAPAALRPRRSATASQARRWLRSTPAMAGRRVRMRALFPLWREDARRVNSLASRLPGTIRLVLRTSMADSEGICISVRGTHCPRTIVWETRSDFARAMITPDGWEYLENKEAHRTTSNQVFVAMSFATELKTVWENGIRPALNRAKYSAYRIDVEPHLDRIDAKIIAEINASKFLVADVTQQRPGVYFEADYALGIGIPVFWCVRKNELATVHFDTRQYNHIVWTTPEKIQEKLYDFIRALVGEGSAT